MNVVAFLKRAASSATRSNFSTHGVANSPKSTTVISGEQSSILTPNLTPDKSHNVLSRKKSEVRDVTWHTLTFL
jgi:hypothetical protein